MSPKSHRLALVGALATAFLTASSAQAATLEQDYTCRYPLIGSFATHLTTTQAVPTTATIGVPASFGTLTSNVTSEQKLKEAFAVLGATTVEGNINSSAAIVSPGSTVDYSTDPGFGPIPANPSGALVYSGSTGPGSVTFTAAGAGSESVTALSLRITVHNAGGTISFPDENGVTSDRITVPCTLNSGQPTRLASFTIKSLPPTIASVTGTLRGATGGSVLIQGTNLDTTTTVKVGGQPGQILARSGTQLMVTLPARPYGTQTLVVTNPSGSASTAVYYQ